jgi:hypothetical protein
VSACLGEHRAVGTRGGGTERSNLRRVEEEESDCGTLLEEEELDRLVLRVVHDEVDGEFVVIARGVLNLAVHLERGATQDQHRLHQNQRHAHIGSMQRMSSGRAARGGGKCAMLVKWKRRFFFVVDPERCCRGGGTKVVGSTIIGLVFCDAGRGTPRDNLPPPPNLETQLTGRPGSGWHGRTSARWTTRT